MEKVKIAIVGCGKISPIYMQNCTRTFEILDVVACSDLIPERSHSKAEEFGVPIVCTTEEIMANPEIEIIVNLTTPDVHAAVNFQALEAGKHVHCEKPLAVTREDGYKSLQMANEKNLRIGGAPDTFLGAGIQTCRKLIDDGWIGKPVAATAFMMGRGHEHWHPDPEFYYQVGGGPMFDMGPYYVTALVTLLGPVKRVTGSTGMAFAERTITSQPKYGKKIQVEVPTHVTGLMDFASGAIGTIITSFDLMGGSQLPHIEIYGTEGTLSVPDPNCFGGPVLIRKKDGDWKEVPLTHGFADNSRGIGVADMATALRSGRLHRANGNLTYHVLDIMTAFHEASREGRHIEIQSTVERPAPLPLGLSPNALDA
jgi:predicted dehydrogenase